MPIFSEKTIQQGTILVRNIVSSKMLLLLVFWLLAKYTLYTKIGAGYFRFFDPENTFFPSFLTSFNPFWIDLATIAAFVLGKRWSYFIGFVLTFVMVVHPYSFGFQHYVMSLYMFLWLFLKDESGSVFFGRVTLSFLYMAATIGKATQGWISGDHYGEYLRHLEQHPLLIIGGEFLFGIAFLLPFYIGIFIPIFVILGMIYSISWLIFDAVGPILGMLLTFVIFRESRNTSIKLVLPDDGKLNRILNQTFMHLNLPFLQPELNEKSHTVSVFECSTGKEYKETQAVIEVLRRIPILSIFCPVLSFRNWSQFLRY